MLVIARNRSFRPTRAVVIHRTVYFLVAGLLVAVESSSAGLLNHSFTRAVVARRAFNWSRRSKRAVVPINAGNTVLLFKSLNSVQVSARRARLRLDCSNIAEVTLGAFLSSHVSDSHLVAEVSASALLTLVLIHTLEKGVESTLGALEHERIVQFLISTRRAPMADRTRVSISVSVLTDHTRLASSAVRNLFGLELLRISLEGASLHKLSSLGAVIMLVALTTGRVGPVITHAHRSVADVSSSACLSDQSSSTVVRSCAGVTISVVRISIGASGTVELPCVTTRALRSFDACLLFSKVGCNVVVTEKVLRAGLADSVTQQFRDESIGTLDLVDQVSRAMVANLSLISSS